VEWHGLWTRLDLLPIAVMAAALAGYAIWQTGWRNCAGMELVAITFLTGLWSARMIPFFGLCFSAYVPAWLAQTPLLRVAAGGMAQARWLPYFCGVAACVFLVAGLLDRPWTLRVAGQPLHTKGYYPVGAVQYLQRVGFQGNVMVPFDW